MQSVEDYLEHHNVPKVWRENIGEILLTTEEIQVLVKNIANEINNDYADQKDIVLIGLLKGSLLFFADLSRQLSVPYKTDFIIASSYSGSETTGTVVIKKDVDQKSIEGKHVIVVEDLIDTGITLEHICAHLKSKNPASVKLACLLNKVERRRSHTHVDYVGKVIPDKFVVGYGMDFDEEYRCLPFVGVIKSSQ